MRSDFRRAWQFLVRNPTFTAVSVLSLAMGISASSAIFSFVNGVLLAPLPFPGSDRLVLIQETVRGPREPASPQRYPDWLQAPSLSSVTGFYSEDFSVQMSESPEHISGYRTFGDFFKTFHAQPRWAALFPPMKTAGPAHG